MIKIYIVHPRVNSDIPWSKGVNIGLTGSFNGLMITVKCNTNFTECTWFFINVPAVNSLPLHDTLPGALCSTARKFSNIDTFPTAHFQNRYSPIQQILFGYVGFLLSSMNTTYSFLFFWVFLII